MVTPRKAILNLNNADELAAWGRARAANAQPITVSQRTTFFGDRTPQQNTGVYDLGSLPPVDAVMSINQWYPYGTGPDISQIQASAKGIKNSTTRDNYVDNLRIRKLQPGDTVLLTGKDNALYGRVTGKGGIDPVVFEDSPQGRQARINYAAAEGGNENYAKRILFGERAKTATDIKNGNTFNIRANRGVGAGANVLYYDAKGSLIPLENLPLAHKEQIARTQQYNNLSDQVVDGVDWLYKDSAFGWGQPATATTVAPMLNADINNQTYSPQTLAAMGKFVDNGEMKNVFWHKDPSALEEARVPRYKNAQGDQVPVTGEARALFDQYGNKPYFVSAGKDNFINKNKGKEVYPVDSSNLPQRRDMQTVNEFMRDLDREIKLGAGRNPYDPYAPVTLGDVIQEDPSLQGYNEIQEYAARGGSGTTWTNDKSESLRNLFYTTHQSQGNSMVNQDLARGGKTPAYPAATPSDFIGDRIGYTASGIPVDVSPDRRLLERFGPTLDGRTSYVVRDNSRLIHPGISSFTPASEMLVDTTPQVTRDLRTGAVIRSELTRPIVRFETTPETPLSRVETNEYGLAVAPQQGRIARSVQLRNGTLPIDNNEQMFVWDGSRPDVYKGKLQYTGTRKINPLYGKPEMSSAGRWIGGSMTDSELGRSFGSGIRSGKSSSRDPLNSYYKIPSDYAALLPATDDRVIAARYADTVARQQAAAINETIEPAFTRNYTITQTGREIQPQFEENMIEGAYIPVTWEGERDVNTLGYAPYVPSQESAQVNIGDGLTRLDKHLADVMVELDGRKYPLTPEATIKPYIPSDAQRSAESVARHGRVKINRYGDWDDIDGPSQAELDAIEQGRMNFNPGKDIANARAKGVGLSDGAEIYANPNIEPTDINGAIAEAKRKLARIKAGINNYYSSPSARIPTDAIVHGDSPLLNDPRLASRFINADEAARIQAENEASRVARLRTVKDVDGNEYIEDMSYVSKRDLANIFDEGQNYSVLPSYLESEIARAEAAVNQLMSLESQPEIEIIANTSERKAATLAEQARQLGMKAVDAEGNVRIVGSIPYGSSLNLPVKRTRFQPEVDIEIAEMHRLGRLDRMEKMRGERIIYPDGRTPIIVRQKQNPVFTTSQVPHTPRNTMNVNADYYGEALASMLQGNQLMSRTPQPKRVIPDPQEPLGFYSTPTKIVTETKAIHPYNSYQPDWSQAYIAGERPQLTPEQQERLQQMTMQITRMSSNQSTPTLVSSSADPYYNQQLAETVNASTPDSAAKRAYQMQLDQFEFKQPGKQWAEQVEVAMPEPPPTQDPRFVEDYGKMFRGGTPRIPRSPQLTPVDNYTVYRTVDDVTHHPNIQTDFGRQRVIESMQEPQYVSYQDLQSTPLLTPPTPRFDPRQLPSWAIPAGIGGVWLGAAGINEYQRQQEQRQQDEEMQLRRLYAGY